MGAEPVYTVNGYYDGPELGVAEFRGIPHVFVRASERRDGKPEDYHLGPIDSEGLKSVLEDWKLYQRWELSGVDKSGVDDSPRVLAADLQRYLELRPLVEAALTVDDSTAFRVKAIFSQRMSKVEWL